MFYDAQATNAGLFSKLGLLSANGRRGRLDYLIMAIALDILCGIFAGPSTIGSVFGLIIGFAMFNNYAKRFHDLNKPTMWAIGFVLLNLIPAFIPELNIWLRGAIVFCTKVYLLFFAGTKGDNDYGPEPK